MMLPTVIPMFVVPRIVTHYLAHRFSGRDLLTAGLSLVCLGLFALALAVRDVAYSPLMGGMVIVGVGAGLLNGETTKVGMTVIPKERSGMASGISGTVRFTGLVVGIAALGAVLYSRITLAVAEALPQVASDSCPRHNGGQSFRGGSCRSRRLEFQGARHGELCERLSRAVFGRRTVHADFDNSNLVLGESRRDAADPGFISAATSPPNKSSETAMTDLKCPACEHAGEMSV
jgi:hypothetical protein